MIISPTTIGAYAPFLSGIEGKTPNNKSSDSVLRTPPTKVRPAYLYTNQNGRAAELELIEVGGVPVQGAQSIQEQAGVICWQNIAP